jgi:hypothetical protein
MSFGFFPLAYALIVSTLYAPSQTNSARASFLNQHEFYQKKNRDESKGGQIIRLLPTDLPPTDTEPLLNTYRIKNKLKFEIKILYQLQFESIIGEGIF